ncbi:32869_t:CDS:2 [Gigaspora margarita]|uniref:32869_t:CDS:1 n=1 Tax=Gigaspora margarita TaxID=4874 RepID=A0ABN7VCK9_GIGMA|nr:32869_t:CDS:2 [Gigaspora margarita]
MNETEQAYTYMDEAEQMSTYMDEAEQMPTYMDKAEQMSFYMDEVEQIYIYTDEAKQASIYIGEAEVGESSSSQSEESNPIQSKGSSSKTTPTRSFMWNYFKKKGNKAKCDFCGTELVYQDGTISNLKKHLKIHRSRVPELNESKVKKGGITVIEILNNKASVS